MEMQSRNENSNENRNVLSNEEVDVSHHQEENTSEQMTLPAMHSPPYLNYPSHSQMMGMPQMVPAHGIENHFQVITI